MNERVSECIRVKYQRGVRRKGASRASGSARYSWAWLGFGRGRLNFGTAENNCKTKPARARLWDSTVVFHSSDEEWKRWKAQLSSAHLRIGRSKEEPDR